MSSLLYLNPKSCFLQLMKKKEGNMIISISSKCFLVHLLLVLGCAHCGHHEETETLGFDETNVLRIHGVDGNTHHHGHMHHMDTKEKVFFIMNDLKIGNKIPIYFPKKDPSTSPPSLPKEEADSIPFSYDQLHYLLKFFSFPKGSTQAKAMEETLRGCENKPIEGETKICATSIESMLDYVRSVFGLESQYRVLTTTHLTKTSVLFENYTIIEEPKEIPAPKVVACHTMPYPYAIFYCHSQASESKVFMVSMVGDDGDRVDAVALCHMDTSQWNRDHAAFRVLRIQPGSSHACHFFPSDNLVYVPLPTTNVFDM